MPDWHDSNHPDGERGCPPLYLATSLPPTKRPKISSPQKDTARAHTFRVRNHGIRHRAQRCEDARDISPRFFSFSFPVLPSASQSYRGPRGGRADSRKPESLGERAMQSQVLQVLPGDKGLGEWVAVTDKRRADKGQAKARPNTCMRMRARPGIKNNTKGSCGHVESRPMPILVFVQLVDFLCTRVSFLCVPRLT